MKKIIFTFFMVLFTLIISTKAYCELLVNEIVDRANKVSFYAGADGKALVGMTITDNQGRVRKRVMNILRMDIEDGGDQKFYVYFKEPADIEDMV